jgi:hypothetical protein
MGITLSGTWTQYNTTEDKPNSEIFQTCAMYDVFFIPPLLLKLRCITYLIQQDWFVVYTYSACLESSSKPYKKTAYFCMRREQNHHSIINSSDLLLLHKQKCHLCRYVFWNCTSRYLANVRKRTVQPEASI